MSATMTTVGAVLLKIGIRLFRRWNNTEFDKFAAECKKKDKEAGYDTYKNE